MAADNSCRNILFLGILSLACVATAQTPAARNGASPPSLRQLILEIQSKADLLQNTAGMRESFHSFTAAYKLSPDAVRYRDFVIVRLIYEATRDAGFWNLHWTITDQPPISDQVWKQWGTLKHPTPARLTAIAECDELSALYAFLVRRAGVHGVGLFWPAANHTVAVWELHPANAAPVRVVVPTSQIFLDFTDSFGTRKFNPWNQKTIFEYKRQDAPDSFEFPRPLFDLFLRQIDRYAGASDATLQQLRYLREGVFLKVWTPEAAAQDALRRRTDLHSGPAEDLAAFWNFAEDMRSAAVP
jgi:hypothetical protein